MIAKQVAECLKAIEPMRLENLELKNQVNHLTTQLAEPQQYSLCNCVEIFSVPEVENENVLQMVKPVGSEVKFMSEDGMVDPYCLGKISLRKADHQESLWSL